MASKWRTNEIAELAAMIAMYPLLSPPFVRFTITVSDVPTFIRTMPRLPGFSKMIFVAANEMRLTVDLTRTGAIGLLSDINAIVEHEAVQSAYGLFYPDQTYQING